MLRQLWLAGVWMVIALVLGQSFPLVTWAMAIEPTGVDNSATVPSELVEQETVANSQTQADTQLMKEVTYNDRDGLGMYAVTTFKNDEGLSLTDWVAKYNPYDSAPVATTFGSVSGLLFTIQDDGAGPASPHFYYQKDATIMVISGREDNKQFRDFAAHINPTNPLLSWAKTVIGIDKAQASGLYVLPFYTDRPITCGFGCYAGHTGTDYGLPNSTRVAAAADGQAWNYYYPGPSNYGNLLILKHSDNKRSRYAHLSQSLRTNGTLVTQGELIAYSGNSGGPWCQVTDSAGKCTRWGSPYHMHFETRINAYDSNYLSGTAVNPYTNNQWKSNPPKLALPRHRARHDVTGNGVSDTLAYNRNDGTTRLDVFDNAGNARMQWQLNTGTGWTNYFGDFNGDSYSDKLSYNVSTGDVRMQRSDTNGNFTTVWTNKWDTRWNYIVAGDFNGDTRDDIIVYNDLSGGARVLLSNSDAPFRQAANIWLGYGWTPVTGDFNTDGIGDLLVYNKLSGDVRLYTADSTGALNQRWTEKWSYGWNIYAGDFNGDNQDDILAYSPNYGWTDVLQGRADTRFTMLPYFWLDKGLQMSVGNYNGSGSDDVLLYNPSTGQVALNLGNAEANLSQLWTRSLGQGWTTIN